MKAKELIFKMLTENTGSHMLDSGGAYGRNWERNAKKTIEDFENEPEAWLEINSYKRELDDGSVKVEHWFDVTISVYHQLCNNLMLDEVCEEFNALPVDDWAAEDFYGVSEAGEQWIRDRGFEILDRGSRDGGSFNTYNWSANFTQVLQGSFLELDGNKYVLLQVHGGCDVRGGYTDAKLFRLKDDLEGHYYLLDEYACFDLNPPDADEPDESLYLDWMGQEFVSREGQYVSGDELEALGARVGEGMYKGYIIGR